MLVYAVPRVFCFPHEMSRVDIFSGESTRRSRSSQPTPPVYDSLLAKGTLIVLDLGSSTHSFSLHLSASDFGIVPPFPD